MKSCKMVCNVEQASEKVFNASKDFNEHFNVFKGFQLFFKNTKNCTSGPREAQTRHNGLGQSLEPKFGVVHLRHPDVAVVLVEHLEGGADTP